MIVSTCKVPGDAKERKRLAGNSVGEPLLVEETRFIVRS